MSQTKPPERQAEEPSGSKDQRQRSVNGDVRPFAHRPDHAVIHGMKVDKLFFRLVLTCPESALEPAGMKTPYSEGRRQQALEPKETA